MHESETSCIDLRRTGVYLFQGKDTILHVIHSNVPDSKAEGIEKGWHEHYWKPWKQHLAGKKIKRPNM